MGGGEGEAEGGIEGGRGWVPSSGGWGKSEIDRQQKTLPDGLDRSAGTAP